MRTFYEQVGMAVLLACFVTVLFLMILSLFSGGVVVIDFNHFGELGGELLLLLVSVPAVWIIWRDFMRRR